MDGRSGDRIICDRDLEKGGDVIDANGFDYVSLATYDMEVMWGAAIILSSAASPYPLRES